MEITRPELIREEIQTYCPYLGWRTPEVVKHTMERTTQISELERQATTFQLL